MNPAQSDHSASIHNASQQIQEAHQQNDAEPLNPSAAQPSRIQQILELVSRRFTLKNISQGLLLVLLLALIVYFARDSLDNPVLRAKRLFKLGGSTSIELAGMDETSFRAYYYYLQMVEQAKVNAKKKTGYEQGSKKYAEISFWELYSLFKVVTAIQNAKNYSTEAKIQEQIKEQIKYDNIEQLQRPYNYTQYFNPAANQYSCGSCYSFPITATIEYLYKKKLNLTLKLSEQQLIDCSDETVENGCKRGNMTKGFEYAAAVGLVQTSEYPYRSKGGNSFQCRKDDVVQNKNISRYKISGFRTLPEGDCMSIQNQLAKGNVVASMINAEQLSSHQKGTFRNCRKDGFNHAITIVGQTENQQWIVRNSWGSSWGDNGYFLMGKGNTCGVCTHMIVPELNLDQKGNVIPLK